MLMRRSIWKKVAALSPGKALPTIGTYLARRAVVLTSMSSQRAMKSLAVLSSYLPKVLTYSAIRAYWPSLMPVSLGGVPVVDGQNRVASASVRSASPR
jgi:hypothetical protein